MNSGKWGTAAVLVAAVVFTAASHAATNHYNAEGRQASQSPPSQEAGKFTTKAKVAYFYTRGDGTDRSKNVADFQNPSTGIYCIEPSVPVNLKEDEPLVSIEWGTSSGSALLAYWRDVTDTTDCPTGYMEVQTYDFNGGGSPVVSSSVSFNLVIE